MALQCTKTISRYSKRIKELGFRASARVVKHRMHGMFFSYYWRNKARERRAHHAWHDIMMLHGMQGDADETFAFFFTQASRNSYAFLDTLCPTNSMYQTQIISDANDYGNHYFSILGSTKRSFTNIPWHTDVRLQEQNPTADSHFDHYSFYKDIVIEVGQSERLLKDIKVPWELSRLQHLPIIAKAYSVTGDAWYAEVFVHQVTDWDEKNPFMLGVNWVCPMEVAIRAVNLIAAYAWLRKSVFITPSFWQRFACLLYDHYWYLEHNWEIYDTRTSNHYLADLIGYYYLGYFFSPLSGMTAKMNWCKEELLREFDKQIFDEGVSYESSTGYHRLVAEMFYHFFLVSNQASLPLPDRFTRGLSRMIDALGWFSYAVKNGYHRIAPQSYSTCADQIVSVGDFDSGRLFFTGLPDTLFERMHLQYAVGAMHFPEAGLSVCKKNGWHITVRHHAYHKRQPSSHQHADAASITVAVNGLPVIVDPGSFVYTPSVLWRNRFRSVTAHNSFYIQDHEPVPLSHDPFSCVLPEMRGASTCDARGLMITTHHDLYACFGLRVHRAVAFDCVGPSVIITDSWEARRQHHDGLTSVWGFMLAPNVSVYKQGNGWLLKPAVMHGSLYFESPDLIFTPQQAWVAKEYGVKVQAVRLVATDRIIPGKQIRIFLSEYKM